MHVDVPLQALGGLGPQAIAALPDIRALWDSGDDFQRAPALAAMGRIAGDREEIHQLLVDGLGDHSEMVRGRAMAGLANLPGREAETVELLIRRAGRYDPWDRQFSDACYAARVYDDRAIPVVRELLSDPEPGVRRAAIEMVGFLKIVDLAPQITAPGASEDISTRVGVMEALERLESPTAVPWLLERLDVEDWTRRRVAASALVRIDPEAAIARQRDAPDSVLLSALRFAPISEAGLAVVFDAIRADDASTAAEVLERWLEF